MAKTIDVELPVDIFDVQVNIPLIHQVVVAQLAAARQGSADVKTRAEVRGGGRKPYRQKGTGRARQGSIRAPQYNGGGVVHGPTPRSFDQRTPKKMKAAALRGALSDRVRSGRVHVVESLAGGNTPSTQAALSTLRELTSRPRVLVVVNTGDTLTVKSLRNVPNVELLPFDQLNTYDVLRSDDLVFTKAAYDAFVAARAGEGVDTITLSKAVTEVEKAPAKAPPRRLPPRRLRPRRRPRPRRLRPRRRLPRRLRLPRRPRPRRPRPRRPRPRRRRRRRLPPRRPLPRRLPPRRPRRPRRRPPRRPRQEEGRRRPVSTVHKDHRDVLIAPVVSEKSYGLLDDNKYTFVVHPDANKTEIKIAVEKIFGVKVTAVNTMNRKGKARRTRNGLGQRKDTKRAIVSVAAGQSIDIFSSPS